MDASERRKRASEEAATWWIRLQSQELSKAEREQFVDWLRESAVHVAEMLRVEKVHGALGQFQRWAQLSTDASREDENVVSLPGRTVPRLRGRRLWMRTLAAGLPVVAVVALLFSSFSWFSSDQTIQTERGERREVALADGSVVEIDPETRLRVSFGKDTRQVYLESGRALFRVARSPNRPFLVQADGTTIRAIGTAFGVECQKKGIVVTVAEGKVAVFGKSDEAADTDTERGAAPTRTSSAESRAHARAQLFLTADQQVTVQPSGGAEPVLRHVDSERELAWARGRLVFDNDTVATAIEEFNRYNRVQLHVADASLAGRTVSAVFDASDPESFVAFIQTVASVNVIRTDAVDITLAMRKP